MKFNFLTCLAVLLIAASSVVAQAPYYVYFADSLGTSNSDFSGNYQVGDTGSIYVYWDHNLSDMDMGAFIDIATDTPGVIDITGGETFEFEISIVGQPIGYRWSSDGMGLGGSFGAGAVSDDGQKIEMNAFTVTGGDGILAGNTGPVFLDEGYDPEADAFLFARFDFVAIGNGTTNLIAEPGAGGIASGGQLVPATFGGLQISVGIPEPNTAGFLAVTILGVFSRRRRTS